MMLRFLSFLPFFLLAALCLMLYVGLHSSFEIKDGDGGKNKAIGVRPLPAFSITSLKGTMFGLDDFLQDEAVLLNVWASWCKPCQLEHPHLMGLSEKGILVYGLNYKDDKKAALRFLKRFGNPFVKTGFDETGKIGLSLGMFGVPETFILKGGNIIFHHQGILTQHIIDETISPLLQ